MSKPEKQIAVRNGEVQTVALEWRRVPDSLPPDPHGGWFSPSVWLALSDGTVVRGKCLHKKPDATYDAPVHDWFADDCQISRDVEVIAWMPFAVPEFPCFLAKGITKVEGGK